MVNSCGMSNLISILASKKDKVGIFDLETQYLFVELDPNLNKLNWKQKKATKTRLIPKLKVAIAGLLTFDTKNLKPVYTYYGEKEIFNLEKDLLKLDKIVGHNLHEFDYHVLAPYFSEGNITLIKAKTIDTWKLLRDETGEWMRLDDLAKLNFWSKKTIDTLEIPKMWREGKYSEVQEYLERDLDISAQLFCYGISQTSLEYYLMGYGKVVKGKSSKAFNWERLIE